LPGHRGRNVPAETKPTVYYTSGYNQPTAPRQAGPVSNIVERRAITAIAPRPTVPTAQTDDPTSTTKVVDPKVEDPKVVDPTGPAVAKEPRSFFDLEEIRAALAAITARFELERGGLKGTRSGLQRAFELLSGRIGKDRSRTLRESKAASSGSGRIRSGLFLRDQAEINDEFADTLIRARAASDVQITPIEQLLGSLNARRDAERAKEARSIGREQMATREEIARALELV
jgi:hypothetical protein